MHSRFLARLTVWAIGMTGLLASAQVANAGYFEYTSKLSISAAPGSFDPSNATIINAGNKTATIDTGINSVTLSAFDSNVAPPHLNGSLGTNISPINVSAATGVTSEAIDFNFSLDLKITNYTSLTTTTAGASGTVSFTGRMSGNVGNGAVALNLLSFAAVPQDITIDGEKYTITLGGFSSPTLDTGGNLSLHVSSVPAINITPVPEPGSLALILIGVGGTFGVYRRRNRTAA